MGSVWVLVAFLRATYSVCFTAFGLAKWHVDEAIYFVVQKADPEHFDFVCFEGFVAMSFHILRLASHQKSRSGAIFRTSIWALPQLLTKLDAIDL